MNKPKIRIRREDVGPNENLCEYCTAKCCRYFALSIDTPRTAADFDYLRWYLLHDRASLFVEGETWYLLVHTVCKHLQDDNRCGIYETRPHICREYTTDGCEFDDSFTYDIYSKRLSRSKSTLTPDLTSPKRSVRRVRSFRLFRSRVFVVVDSSRNPV